MKVVINGHEHHLPSIRVGFFKKLKFSDLIALHEPAEAIDGWLSIFAPVELHRNARQDFLRYYAAGNPAHTSSPREFDDFAFGLVALEFRANRLLDYPTIDDEFVLSFLTNRFELALSDSEHMPAFLDFLYCSGLAGERFISCLTPTPCAKILIAMYSTPRKWHERIPEQIIRTHCLDDIQHVFQQIIGTPGGYELIGRLMRPVSCHLGSRDTARLLESIQLFNKLAIDQSTLYAFHVDEALHDLSAQEWAGLVRRGVCSFRQAYLLACHGGYLLREDLLTSVLEDQANPSREFCLMEAISIERESAAAEGKTQHIYDYLAPLVRLAAAGPAETFIAVDLLSKVIASEPRRILEMQDYLALKFLLKLMAEQPSDLQKLVADADCSAMANYSLSHLAPSARQLADTKIVDTLLLRFWDWLTTIPPELQTAVSLFKRMSD